MDAMKFDDLIQSVLQCKEFEHEAKNIWSVLTFLELHGTIAPLSDDDRECIAHYVTGHFLKMRVS